MQLFISSLYTKDQNNIAITDERIVHQCFHVLRYKSWQTLQLQDNWVRYTLSIAHISKKEIQTHIQSTEIANSTLITHNLQLCIALPNRREKAELIVQKLTEIGIDNIIIRTADRSILRDIPEKKLQRLQSIALEAAEQSFRRSLPTITYLDNLFESTILSSGQVVLFHQDWVSANQLNTSNLSADKAGSKLITSLIGPEWGFSANELYKFSTLSNCVHINLWDTILRMETAAIIWSRLLKNL